MESCVICASVIGLLHLVKCLQGSPMLLCVTGSFFFKVESYPIVYIYHLLIDIKNWLFVVFCGSV